MTKDKQEPLAVGLVDAAQKGRYRRQSLGLTFVDARMPDWMKCSLFNIAKCMWLRLFVANRIHLSIRCEAEKSLNYRVMTQKRGRSPRIKHSVLFCAIKLPARCAACGAEARQPPTAIGRRSRKRTGIRHPCSACARGPQPHPDHQ